MSSTTLTAGRAASAIEVRDGVALLGRLLLVALFLWSGFGKLAAPAGTIAYIQSAGLPFPEGAYAVALLMELVGSALLLLGVRVRIVAALMAVFTLGTALGFHTDFADQNQMINFFKNISIIGGLLQIVAFGGGRLSLTRD